ncbi:MAG: UDP-N-acetylmuramate--L-alanine ligase [Nitrospirae bacterium]|nr:UDP-N-acetylmuramate--L-alanine ligase [Nitrospirota bacterium]
MYRQRVKNIHFVGIGGIGMSGIAEVLLTLGYRVSGSDLKESETTQRLCSLGGAVFIGHRPEQVQGAHVVVLSSAVTPDNPEVRAAREALIPVIPRAEMLAELMRLKYGIAVAGAHGKTTTTSMAATVLAYGGLDPTVVIGGRLNSLGSNARLGQGEFLVAEADESDGSFLRLSPTIAVVTNIDAEHLDYYGTLDAIQEAFLRFINKVPFYGTAVLCLDEPAIQSLLPRVEKRYLTYGFTPQADVMAKEVLPAGIGSSFEVLHRQKGLGRFTLSVPGVHNVANALAAVAVGLELEIPPEGIREALAGFSGVQRRFEIKGEAGGILVVDDYGHHPTEIRATLAAAKRSWDRRTVVVFQPHRYTRTRDLLSEFFTAFHQADRLLLTEIYPAGEPPIPGVSGRQIGDGVRKHGHRDASFFETKEALVDHLLRTLEPGDLLLTLGAGDVWKVGEEVLARIADSRQQIANSR